MIWLCSEASDFDALIRKSELIQVNTARGRPKTTLEVIKNDLSIKGVTENMTSNRI